MSGIVCAIRGGPASRPTIMHSIALAQKTGLPLHFLYVVNLDFLSHTSSSRVHTITQEMEQMGAFILLTARAAAAEKGVTAQGDVRNGDVTEEIITLCNAISADTVVIGRPQVRQTENLLTQERLPQFAEHIEAQTKAKVVMTPAGDE